MNKGAFNPETQFSPACIEHYNSEGWVLIKGFFDYQKEILPIHADVNNLIHQKRLSLKLSPLDKVDTEIDNRLFLDLCNYDRKLGGEIYKACRHLPSALSLLTSKKCTEYAMTLMRTRFLNSIPYVPLRVDIRGEEKYLLNWHQDYPYIQGSMDGVVLWTPLFTQRKFEGGVAILPRTHLEGLRKVCLIDPQNKANQNGGSSIQIDGVEAFDQMPFVHFEVEASDALIFNTLLIHKSMPMIDETIRWSLQLRFGNFNHEDAIKRGWPNGMIEGNWFEFDHPEYVVNT